MSNTSEIYLPKNTMNTLVSGSYNGFILKPHKHYRLNNLDIVYKFLGNGFKQNQTLYDLDLLSEPTKPISLIVKEIDPNAKYLMIRLQSVLKLAIATTANPKAIEQILTQYECEFYCNSANNMAIDAPIATAVALEYCEHYFEAKTSQKSKQFSASKGLDQFQPLMFGRPQAYLAN